MTPFHELGGGVRHRLLLHGSMEKPMRFTSEFNQPNPWRSMVSVWLGLGLKMVMLCWLAMFVEYWEAERKEAVGLCSVG